MSFAPITRALRRLHRRRTRTRKQVSASGSRRGRLTAGEREQVFNKTGGRCHICGGALGKDRWKVDHLFARASGGSDAMLNYLPAHKACNRDKWHYSPEEFQYIVKLGIWLRHEIEKGSRLGRAVVANKRLSRKLALT